ARKAAAMAVTPFCPRHQAVLASCFATSSTTRMKVTGSTSSPPKGRGSRRRKSPASWRRAISGSGSLRSRSISSAAAAISGPRARARSTGSGQSRADAVPSMPPPLLELQDPSGGAAQDHFALGRGEAERVDEAHRPLVAHVVAIVAAEDDVVSADLADDELHD